MKKSLSELIKDLEVVKILGEVDAPVSGIADNSKNVEAGFVFIAVEGLRVDGHDFIHDAINKGAVAIICEKLPEKTNKSTMYVQVKNSRAAVGVAASAWFGKPSEKLTVIGVTGTDGKTTTANLIYAMLTAAGKKAGLVSSVNAKIGKKAYDTGFHVTNPEPLMLQELLKKMVDEGCEYAVLEVTSHGLDQERTAGVKFDIGVLTNITHEHLDYHKTYENYLKAKAKLFKGVRLAILNKEDQSYDPIAKMVNTGAKIASYDASTAQGRVAAAINQRFKESYNKLNAAAASLAAKEAGVIDSDIAKAIFDFETVPGRMEEVPNDKGIRIIIDFAHTPNSLEKVLTALSEQKGNGKLIAVFGCASERDVAKRPLMGGIATRIADFTVFTAEDPRREDIDKIFAQMETKVSSKNYTEIPERGEAIHYAINKIAHHGDIVVICGKGHEGSMAYNGVEYPWSDLEAVNDALAGKVKEIKR